MGTKTWIYITILIVVLLGAGIFFWWIYTKGKITPVAGPTPTPTPTTFSDVPSTSQFFKEIEAVNKAGYMIGYHEFRPEEQATRATAAVAVAKTYGKTASPAPTTPSFSDVGTDYWAYAEIEGLKAAGWVDGYQDGTFKPDSPADRATAIVFAAAAKAGGKANVPEPADSSVKPFTDVDSSNWAYKYIVYAKDQGIATGYSDGTFRPTEAATRATVAVAVARAHGDSYDNASPSFMDVPRDYWAYKEIEGLYKIGGISGFPPTFKPTAIADRATLAVVIARATSNIFDNPTPSFKDAGYDKNFWAYKEIEGVNKAGFMVGFGDGTFRPNEAITRTDVAIVLARAKGLPLDPAPAVSSFTDVQTTDPAFKAIEAIYKAGYTKGCEQTEQGLKFCPETQVTREVLAAFTYNAFIASGNVSPSPAVVSPSPETSPSAVASPSPTPTPSTTLGASPTPTETTTETTGTTGTTSTAQTGPEIPLASGGLLSILLIGRYLINRRIR